MHVSPMPSTTSGPFPATVRGLGIGRGVLPLQPGHTQSVPGSVPRVSQTSPIPSPSLSFWSGLYWSGQFSPELAKPSPVAKPE